MILETARLLLRPLVESDVATIQHYFPHWEIVKKMNGNIPWPYPDDGAMRFYKDVVEPNQGKDRWFWAINERNRPDHLIGVIELSRYARPSPSDGHRGFWLALPFQGRGYMTEAAEAVNDFGFRVWEMPEIIACAAVGNAASAKVKEKQGMRWVRRETCAPVQDGTDAHDVFIMTHQEWLYKNIL